MTLSRRQFLASTAIGTAGLVIGFDVPKRMRGASADTQAAAPPPLPLPNAFLRIGTDDSVTVLLAHSEMGQGIWTTLAMLIAEELDCDWSKIRSEHALAAPVYAHTLFGFQATTGSFTTRTEFDRYRNVGATAKVLLLRAAATRWKTTPDKLTAENGTITFALRRVMTDPEEGISLSAPGDRCCQALRVASACWRQHRIERSHLKSFTGLDRLSFASKKTTSKGC